MRLGATMPDNVTRAGRIAGSLPQRTASPAAVAGAELDFRAWTPCHEGRAGRIVREDYRGGRPGLVGGTQPPSPLPLDPAPPSAMLRVISDILPHYPDASAAEPGPQREATVIFIAALRPRGWPGGAVPRRVAGARPAGTKAMNAKVPASMPWNVRTASTGCRRGWPGGAVPRRVAGARPAGTKAMNAKVPASMPWNVRTASTGCRRGWPGGAVPRRAAGARPAGTKAMNARVPASMPWNVRTASTGCRGGWPGDAVPRRVAGARPAGTKAMNAKVPASMPWNVRMDLRGVVHAGGLTTQSQVVNGRPAPAMTGGAGDDVGRLAGRRGAAAGGRRSPDRVRSPWSCFRRRRRAARSCCPGPPRMRVGPPA
jgi:hypothetical protein